MQALRVAMAALVVLVATVSAEDTPPPPAKQTTKVVGTLPADLAGRWLALGQAVLTSGSRRSVPVLWEIAGAGDALTLTVHFVTLPPAVQKALDDGNTAEKGWTPAPADLAAIASAWDTLPKLEPGVSSVETELLARDAYDEDIRKDDQVKDSLWMVRTSQGFLPSAAPMIKQVSVYAAQRPAGNGWEGTYVHMMLAAAPFPIPITLKGDFHLYRLEHGLESAAPKGIVARLLDAFSGCGRR